MIKLREFLSEGIPNYFRGYISNIESSMDRLEKNIKDFAKDLGKDGLRSESVELQNLYKKHIIEFKVKFNVLVRVSLASKTDLTEAVIE